MGKQFVKKNPNTQVTSISYVAGDIAFRFLNHVKNRSPRGRQRTETSDAHVTVCDINQAMLDVGQRRAARFHHSSGAPTWYLNVFNFAGSKTIGCWQCFKD